MVDVVKCLFPKEVIDDKISQNNFRVVLLPIIYYSSLIYVAQCGWGIVDVLFVCRMSEMLLFENYLVFLYIYMYIYMNVVLFYLK